VVFLTAQGGQGKVVFFCCTDWKSRYVPRLESMNADLCKQAQELIGNNEILVNLVSTRVRQLNSGSRPLVDEPLMGAANLALTELVEGKMDYELLHEVAPEIATAKSAGK